MHFAQRHNGLGLLLPQQWQRVFRPNARTVWTCLIHWWPNDSTDSDDRPRHIGYGRGQRREERPYEVRTDGDTVAVPEEYQESVNAAAAEAALPKFLVAALVHTESQWYENENAVSL